MNSCRSLTLLPSGGMLALILLLLSSTLPSLSHAQNDAVLSLRDFSTEEVKGTGFTLSRRASITISALGGGAKVSWDDRDEEDGDRSSAMFASGWIINADTRDIVWEMTPENTSGSTKRREANEELTLEPGSYEVYFAAYGYARRSSMINYSINIDRRDSPHTRRHKGIGDFFKELFGFGDEFYEEFMDLARHEWGLTVTANASDRSAISTFTAPKRNPAMVFMVGAAEDNATTTKYFSLSRETTLSLRGLGEGRRRDGMFDFGWITNAETRKRVWEMRAEDSEYAGGAAKNVCVTGEVRLPKGSYEIVFVTDGSHSPVDWNAMPPSDPLSYGITVSVTDARERSAVSVSDAPAADQNVIVALTRMRDDDLRNAGFSLTSSTKVHICALGESSGRKRLADHGWIINTRTNERVWSMEDRETLHAGGASKNRIVDEIITLPKGDYMVYYQTDDSHSYEDWNGDPPYDPSRWGITVSGVGPGFDPKSVKTFSDVQDEGVIAQLIRVKDDRHARTRFTLDARTRVRIYAIGEGSDDDLSDYGWIESAKTGDPVWEMNSETTEHAGGARKNRKVVQTIMLEKGEYELHFRTDDSHAYAEWNDDPPHDPAHWGITLYKEQ